MDIYRKLLDMTKKIFLIRLLIVLLVIVATISVVYIKITINSKSKKTNQQSVNPPKIENYFGNNLKINYDLDKNAFNNFPTTLSYIVQTMLEGFTQEDLNKIASSFGFSNNPLEFNDVKDGKIYIWNNDRYNLVIYSKLRNIEFTPSFNTESMIKTSPNKQLSDNDYKNMAINLLSEKLNIDKKSLKFSNFVYLKIEKGLEGFRVTTKEDSEITQVNLYSSEGPLPIFTVNPRNSQVYIQFTKDGEILSISASFNSKYGLSETEYKIKDYKEVIETFDDSVLVSLNDSNVNLPGLAPEDIKNILVNKISLVYLQENSTNKILQPVFLLEGNATVKGFDNEITASLYLPAFSLKVN